MSYGNYNEPVRYDPSAQLTPQRKPTPRWVFVCCGCLVLLGIVLAVSLFFFMREVENIVPDVREAQMFTGNRLAWRKWDWRPDNSMLASVHMRSMDSDGDGNGELLFIDPENRSMELRNLDGKLLRKETCPVFLDNDMLEIWDGDGNGDDELVWRDFSEGATVHVMELDGTDIQTYKGWELPRAGFIADFDGDGRDDLLLGGHDGRSIRVVAPGGAELLNADRGRDGFVVTLMFADIDGDGRWSVLEGQEEQRTLFEPDGTSRPINVTLPEGQQFWQDYRVALDLDGDSRSELFNFEDACYDFDTQSIFVLKYPLPEDEGWQWLNRIPIVQFDHDGDGLAGWATVPGGDEGCELVIYSQQGDVEYHEATKKFCCGLEVVERNGVQHLVLCAFDEVWIYP